MDELESSWNNVIGYVMQPIYGSTLTPSILNHSLSILLENSMLDVIDKWFFETVSRQVSTNHAPKFWAAFSSPIPEEKLSEIIAEKLGELYKSMTQYIQCLGNICEVNKIASEILGQSVGNPENLLHSGTNDIKLIYRSVVFYKTTSHFDAAIDSFFSQSIRSYNAMAAANGSDVEAENETMEDLESLTCSGCDQDSDSCCCREVIKTFIQTVMQLKSFGAFERLTGEPVMRLVRARIREHVEKKCQGNFDVRYMYALRRWLHTGIIKWMDQVFLTTDSKTDLSRISKESVAIADVNIVIADQSDTLVSPISDLAERDCNKTKMECDETLMPMKSGITNSASNVKTVSIDSSKYSNGKQPMNSNDTRDTSNDMKSENSSNFCKVRENESKGSASKPDRQTEFSDRNKENVCDSGDSSFSTPHNTEDNPSSEVASSSNPYLDLLQHYLCETFARVRISQLFNIIVEFPESQPVLEDLAECMEKVDLRGYLVESLRGALESRLLHPGVNTADILTAFLAAIPALRILDSSGVLLDLVCAPVRRYLRGRTDTVRCIVTSLTEEGSGDLSEELTRGGQLTLDEEGEIIEEEDPGDSDWRAWNPDPVDADSTGGASGRLDIVSILVGIYGSRELFINEYQNILANRILSQFSYDADDREVRYLELLKLRFGEAHLHNCEVMLKDVADSRRINAHISEERNKKRVLDENNSQDPIDVTAMILSAQFWPARLREEKLELPAVFSQALECYTRSYELLKGNRTLSWKPHLGLVTIELEMSPGKPPMEFKVTPVHAAIIYHFQEKEKWTTEELSTSLSMPVHSLQRKLSYWQTQGILREESPDVFILVTDCRGAGAQNSAVPLEDDEEGDTAVASAKDQREEDLQIVWTYVAGMLTNLESLPIERMYSMLKMVTMHGPGSQCTVAELKVLLDRKIREQKLTYNNGLYRLVRQ